MIGSYSNFEALEAEFDRFNEFYPEVELSYVKPDDYNNLLGTVLASSNAPNIFFSYQWMYGNEKYQQVCDHMEDLSDPLAGQVRNAAYLVGTGKMTVDEVVGKYGSFKD